MASAKRFWFGGVVATLAAMLLVGCPSSVEETVLPDGSDTAMDGQTDTAVCVPDCAWRTCGPEPLCGASCGICPDDKVCDKGSCIPPGCEPDCEAVECGLDPLCGAYCGGCMPGERCEAGFCVPGDCVPICGERECGPDPECMTSCGLCDTGFECLDGTCVPDTCEPECDQRECGLDPLCGEPCGYCDAGFRCEDGACVPTGCEPQCGERVCGPDPVCGESCGDCDAGYRCEDGACVPTGCEPDCEGLACGPDPVCGESCGTCETGTCVDGACVPYGGGACNNEDDLAILNTLDIDTVVQECVLGGGCFGAPACVAECMSQLTGMSAGCAECYGELASCGLDNCAQICIRTGNSPECHGCLGEFCLDDFVDCAGVQWGCVPECGTRECGPDPTCGMSCGTCPPGEHCEDGTCAPGPCEPDCTDRECGLDPVCGRPCGFCAPSEHCESGQCVPNTCEPVCGERECGPDPVCGESCGRCDAGEVCSDGTCVPTVDGACNNDDDLPLLNTVDPELIVQTCVLGAGCFQDVECIADCIADTTGISPDCSLCLGDLASCGIDFCLDTCVADGNGPECLACLDTFCMDDFVDCAGVEWGCVPDCTDRECGRDPVCGLSCGTCPATEACIDGQCVPGSPGGCNNPDDLGILNDLDPNFIAEQCVLYSGCGFDVACITTCIEDLTGLSPDCSGCVGELAVCGGQNCFEPCLGGDDLACLACLQDNCMEAFEDCAGVTWGCEPACDGRECGLDPVCGLSCGDCLDSETCQNGVCVPVGCEPDCRGRECGPDPLCGESCGDCLDSETCQDGVCVPVGCVPDCRGRECGPDPLCGESCGDCPPTEACVAGQCVPGAQGACNNPDDLALLEGIDPNWMVETCILGAGCMDSPCIAACIQDQTGVSAECSLCYGDLATCGMQFCIQPCLNGSEAECLACLDLSCMDAFEDCSGVTLGCLPECGGRECGPDPVCGLSCGDCLDSETCQNGVCVPVGCEPDCTNRECGPDPLCGESCGQCDFGLECQDGRCVAAPDTRTCRTPGILACGSLVVSNNAAGASQIGEYVCEPFPETGPEEVFTYRSATSRQITIRLSGMSADLDLFVLQARCDPAACVASSAGTADEVVELTVSANTTYYIIVDGFSGAVSDYQLEIECGCAPDCRGRECGLDPVCGTSCGICPDTEACVDGQCVPVAQGACNNADDLAILETLDPLTVVNTCVLGSGCGTDSACIARCLMEQTGLSEGCAGCYGGLASCGVNNCLAECINGYNPECTACLDAYCMPEFEACSGVTWGCVPECGDRRCGPDPVCGESCGRCAADEECVDGVCVPGPCIPDCSDVQCGPDPICGQICGECPPFLTCQDGMCVSGPCIPDCTNQECGPDPICGESCGDCDAGFTCRGGACVAAPDAKTCERPGALSCGAVVGGDTSLGESRFTQYSCVGYAETGPEEVYRFVSRTTQQVTIELSGMAVDLDLFVLSGACDAGACVAYSAGMSAERLTFTAESGVPYYVVVDGFSGAVDTYRLAATCGCSPDCTNLECGPDPICGVSCGQCQDGYECNRGRCEPSGCVPQCGFRECGPDPVCGEPCGYCAAGEVCAEGVCIPEGCVPDCSAQECGLDPVCGVPCGVCGAGERCWRGDCIPDGCVPDCRNVECGPDPTCGANCGTCPEGETCQDGVCMTEPAQGACDNREDLSILNQLDPMSLAMDCVFGAGCNADPACIAECTADTTGLSGGCSRCVGSFAACGMENCLQSCLTDPAGTECTFCLQLFCQPAFVDCAGVTWL